MTIRYVLAAQLWIGVGLILPIGMTIYGGQSAFIPGIFFSFVVVNIFLMLDSFLHRNSELENRRQIISSGRAAIISFFAWNFFASYVFFWEGKQDIMALMFWVIGGVIAYFFHYYYCGRINLPDRMC